MILTHNTSLEKEIDDDEDDDDDHDDDHHHHNHYHVLKQLKKIN